MRTLATIRPEASSRMTSMTPARRRACAALGVGTAALLWPALARPQKRLLRMLVGYQAGGAVDVVAREVGDAMRVAGFNVVIENRTGAGGRLATEQLLSAPADGSMLVFMPGGNATIFPHVYPNLKYDPLRDLAPIAPVCSFGFALAVGPATPARTLAEFVAWARAHRGQASYGTPGSGTAMHFMGAMFAKAAGFEFVHVPYRGGAAAMVDVLGGTLPALATTLPLLVTPHQQGKLRVLASTEDRPRPTLPGVPTFKDEGYPELVLGENFGIYASSRTPTAVQDELHAAIQAATRQPKVVAALRKLEFDPFTLSRREFAALMRADHERWHPIVQATGYRADS